MAEGDAFDQKRVDYRDGLPGRRVHRITNHACAFMGS